MAVESQVLNRSYPAGQDFSGTGGAGTVAQFVFVTLNASAQLVVPANGASAIGIIQNNPKSGGVGSVCRPGDRSKLLLNGTVAAGGAISSDANGNGIPTVTGDVFLAIAETAGVAGNVITVLFQGRGAKM